MQEGLTPANADNDISSIFEAAIAKLDNIDSEAKKQKKQIIIELAKKLEEKIPVNTISIEIVNRLHGRSSERFIRQCLDEKYKQKSRVENARKQKKKEEGKKEQQEQICNENLAALPPLNQEAKEIAVDVHGREETVIVSPGEPVTNPTGRGDSGGDDDGGVVSTYLDNDERSDNQLQKNENRPVPFRFSLPFGIVLDYLFPLILNKESRECPIWFNVMFEKCTDDVISADIQGRTKASLQQGTITE
ncbi:MAG TPA: hypothetical protein VIW25_02930 [Nitrososphaeraceae archaeon]|jgi:hypothetical protein